MYSIIDIESNGAKYREESIIDIALIRFDGKNTVDQFFSLINPQADISPFVQKLTHITPKMVLTAPKFHEVAKRILEITEGTTLVGHNVEFDYRMLRQSFKRLGFDFKIPTLDTIPLAQKLIPGAESYSLGKLVKSLGIPLTNAHRADADARATLSLFKLLMTKDTGSEIIQQQFEEANAKTYANKIRELTQDLPSIKGILYFQGSDGKILYTEFADDISRAAKQCLQSKAKRLLKIQEETEQIHFEAAGNPLTAKLLMQSKGLTKPEALIFGLYHREGKYLIEKKSRTPAETPLLEFKSVTQGRKALAYIKSVGEFSEISIFNEKISLKNRSEIWSFPGRALGEKTFLILENGIPTAYGFYEYHTQIQHREKLALLQIPLPGTALAALHNELQMALLKNEIDIFPLPQHS